MGKGGTLAIRQYLNLPEYRIKTTISAAQRARKVLESTRNAELNVEEQIPFKDLSSADDLKNLSTLVFSVDEAVQSLETAFADHG